LRIAILGSGPIPNLLAQELNSTEEVELFTSQNVTVNGIKISDYRSLLSRALDFDVVVLAWRGIPRAGTEKAVVLRQLVANSSPESLIINMSSVSVYGQNPNVNFETTVPRPINPYGYSKYFLERYLNIFASSKVCNLRISNVFGHPDFDDVINRIINLAKYKQPMSLIRPDDTLRDFISIRTLVSYMVKFINAPMELKYPKNINFASGKSVNLSELVTIAEKIIKFKLNISVEESTSKIILRSEISTDLVSKWIGNEENHDLKELENFIKENLVVEN
jgi:dTDP-4-dehydrorhamnose reductase